MRSKRQRVSDDDPLTRAMAPPPGETLEERDLRLAAEQEAKRISDAIDDDLNRQRIAEKKSPKAIKILLLGAFHSFTQNIELILPAACHRPERIR